MDCLQGRMHPRRTRAACDESEKPPVRWSESAPRQESLTCSSENRGKKRVPCQASFALFVMCRQRGKAEHRQKLLSGLLRKTIFSPYLAQVGFQYPLGVLPSCQQKGEAFQLFWISLITPQPFGRRSPRFRQQTPGHAVLTFVWHRSYNGNA